MTTQEQVFLRQVFLTVAYSAQFGQSLTKAEICSRLIIPQTGKSDFDRYYIYKRVEEALKQLLALGWLNKLSDRYFVVGQKKQLMGGFQREKQAREKLLEARRVADLLRVWPWIEGIGVSGSVAAGTAGVDDDLDFVMIVRPNSLWLTRIFVLVLAWLFGRRRSFAKEEPRSWCFNMWLESNHLQLELHRRNLYTAYELFQLKPLVGRESYWWLWRENLWVKEKLLLARWLAPARPPALSFPAFVKQVLLNVLTPITLPLNLIAYCLQRWYMRPHQTREQVSLDRAFFHPRDTRKQLYKRWQEVVEKTLFV